MGIFGLGKPNIKKLAEAGNIKELINALSHQEPDIRTQAIEALGTMKQVEAIGPLIKLFGDKNWNIRMKAADALGKIGKPAVDMLLIAINNEDSDFRQNACQALGEIKDNRAVESLINALQDDDSLVRRVAADALGKINDDRAVEPLINALNEWKMREDTLLAQGGVADTGGRSTTLSALGKFRHPKVIEILKSCIKDEFTLISLIAIIALGEIGDSSAVEPLIKALKDPRKEIRGAAAEALGLIGDEKSIKSLKSAADDKEADVRNEIRKALEKIEKMSQKMGPKKMNAHAENDSVNGMENAEMWRRKNSPLIGDFEAECLEAQYTEEIESRRFEKPPELRAIASLGNSGRYKDVIQKARESLKKYPDFDYLYYWTGTAYIGDGDLSSARAILKEGLRKAKSKAFLCLKLGDAELKAQDAKKALKWWCQSIHCHESNPHDLDNSPYLYLGAIAGAYGLKREYDAFNHKAHRIRNADLSYEAMSDIQNLFTDQKTEAIVTVVKRMFEIYFQS